MNNYKCSITVEASLSFSIAIFVLILILGPLFVIESSVKIINGIENDTRNLSYYQMINNNLKDEKKIISFEKIDNNIDDNDQSLNKYIDKNNVKDSIKNLISIGVTISKLLNLNIDKNNAYSNIDLIIPNDMTVYDENSGIIKYDITVFFKLPFNFFNVPSLYQRFVSYKRAFLGIDGNRFINNNGISVLDEIYVSNNFKISKVYHNNIQCNRLVKQTESVYFHDIDNHRNDDNKKFDKCDYCFKNINILNNTIVYITKYGNRYHSYSSCPLMTAYISIVPSSYIEEYGLRLCEICKNNESENND